MKAAHTTTISPIIFWSCMGDCKNTPASSAKSMLYNDVARDGSPAVAPPSRPHPVYLVECARASMMSLSAFKRAQATFITAAKKMLNRRGASTQLQRKQTTPSSSCRRASRLLASQHKTDEHFEVDQLREDLRILTVILEDNNHEDFKPL